MAHRNSLATFGCFFKRGKVKKAIFIYGKLLQYRA